MEPLFITFYVPPKLSLNETTDINAGILTILGKKIIIWDVPIKKEGQLEGTERVLLLTIISRVSVSYFIFYNAI